MEVITEESYHSQRSYNLESSAKKFRSSYDKSSSISGEISSTESASFSGSDSDGCREEDNRLLLEQKNSEFLLLIKKLTEGSNLDVNGSFNHAVQNHLSFKNVPQQQASEE